MVGSRFTTLQRVPIVIECVYANQAAQFSKCLELIVYEPTFGIRLDGEKFNRYKVSSGRVESLEHITERPAA